MSREIRCASRWAVAGLSAVLVVCASATGRAEETGGEAESRAFFAEAQDAYAAGDFRSALSFLKRAYASSPRAAFLFNIGQAQRKLGLCVEARATYDAYRAAVDADSEAVARVDAARRELEACEPHPSEPVKGLATPQSRGADAAQQRRSAEPAPAAAEVAPASSEPVVASPRHAARGDISPPSAAGATSSRADAALRVVTWSLAAGAGVAWIVAGAYALEARSAASELERARSWDAALSAREREGGGAATACYILLGTGTVLLGGAVALHFLSDAREMTPVAITAAPGAALAHYRTSF